MEVNCREIIEKRQNSSNFTLENFTDGFQTIGDEFSVKNISLIILLGVIDIVTIFGNLLVIISFIIERRLIQPFNLFILNLAMTDLFVAVPVLMFYSIDTLLGYWPFGIYMCGVWIYLDYAMTFASVFTLVAISIDRLWCVTWPIHFKMYNNKRKSTVFIAIIWFCVIAIWTPPFVADRLKHTGSRTCRWKPSDNRQSVLFVAVAGHYVPSTIMISCYIKVLLVMRRQRKAAECATTEVKVSAEKTFPRLSSLIPDGDNAEYFKRNQTICKATIGSHTKRSAASESQRSQREKRIFMTLTYILFTFMACWFPYYISFHLSAMKPDLLPAGIYSFSFWLTYVNSTLNPIIYAYTNKEFRQAFIKIKKLICRPCKFCME